MNRTITWRIPWHVLRPMAETSYEGGCLCGAVRYRVSGAARDLCYCHCRSCRLSTGTHCVAWATFERDRFELLRGVLASRRSSPPVVRSFCAACGAAITYAHDATPRELDVTLASLDDARGLAPACHIWVSHKLPWVALGDGLPQFPERRR
jgi:hypothetical protein